MPLDSLFLPDIGELWVAYNEVTFGVNTASKSDFAAQVAFTAGWTAVSSLIGYYKATYGPHMLLHLNLAYFLPSLPTMLLQSVCDPKVDSRFGKTKPAAVRLCIGKPCVRCRQLYQAVLWTKCINTLCGKAKSW